MTDRLYYNDSYLTDFEATVVSRSGDGLRVALDRSAFYPTSGGQLFDTGWLNDSAVVDVVEEDGQVIHVLASPVEGEQVAGRIDWTRRLDHMQQHTGQHLVSAVFEDLFGIPTVSVHFGAQSSSVDLETGELARARVLEVEARANELVFENRPVTLAFEDAASVHGLRKAPPREGALRVVTIAGVDRSACGGTHVRATGEIGVILLRKHDRMHGNVRVEFACGTRAVRRARADFDSLTRAAGEFGVGLDELPDRAAALLAQVKESDREVRRLRQELAALLAADTYRGAKVDARGVRWMIQRIASGSLDDMRAMAHAASALERAAYVGIVQSPPQLLFATSADTGIDAGRILKRVLAEVGGRGGGSARVAQGSVPSDAVSGIVALLQEESARAAASPGSER